MVIENLSCLNGCELLYLKNTQEWWTYFIIVLTGVLVFILGQFLVKLFIESLFDSRKIIDEIKYSLTFYARQISSPSIMVTQEIEEASKNLRGLSSKIMIIPTIRGYNFFSKIKLLPKEKNIEEVQKELMGLSNSLGDETAGELNRERSSNIQKLLSP